MNDILDREEFLTTLFSVVRSKRKSEYKSGMNCFTIDGAWGSGKSWILNKLADHLSKTNTIDKLDDGNIVFIYNAWENDYYEEPLIGILSYIINKINSMNKEPEAIQSTIVHTLLNAFNGFCKNKFYTSPKEIKDLYCEETKIISNNSLDQSICNLLTDINVVLDKLTNNKRIYFLVDELDRCLPTHCIKTLERLHHIFEYLDNSLVILFTDSTSLSKGLSTIFGKEISYDDYMRKFSQFTIKLNCGVVHKKDLFDFYMRDLNKIFNITLDNLQIMYELLNLSDIPIRKIHSIFEEIVEICNLCYDDEIGSVSMNVLACIFNDYQIVNEKLLDKPEYEELNKDIQRFYKRDSIQRIDLLNIKTNTFIKNYKKYKLFFKN